MVKTVPLQLHTAWYHVCSQKKCWQAPGFGLKICCGLLFFDFSENQKKLNPPPP
jgi:hypothetical protein